MEPRLMSKRDAPLKVLLEVSAAAPAEVEEDPTVDALEALVDEPEDVADTDEVPELAPDLKEKSDEGARKRADCLRRGAASGRGGRRRRSRSSSSNGKLAAPRVDVADVAASVTSATFGYATPAETHCSRHVHSLQVVASADVYGGHLEGEELLASLDVAADGVRVVEDLRVDELERERGGVTGRRGPADVSSGAGLPVGRGLQDERSRERGEGNKGADNSEKSQSGSRATRRRGRDLPDCGEHTGRES